MATKRRKRKPAKPAPVKAFDERTKAEGEAAKLPAPIIYADHSGPKGAKRWKIEAATGLKRRSRARGWLRENGKIA